MVVVLELVRCRVWKWFSGLPPIRFLTLELPWCWWSWSVLKSEGIFGGYRLSVFAVGLALLLELARCGRGAGVGAVLGLKVIFREYHRLIFDIGIAVALELARCWSWSGVGFGSNFSGLPPIHFGFGVAVVLELERR